MKCLVVIAHPVHDSLCRALAHHAISTLTAHGHVVVVEDLYAPRCRFGMLSLYRAESLAPEQVHAFRARIDRTLSKWGRA